ncbi:MAG: glycosyltransferase N-terminal domain-containing protein [Bacteroidota bacterium]
MNAIYYLAVTAYRGLLHLAALFQPKARSWVAGRKNWRVRLAAWREQLPVDANIYWMHCASLGEFEQGRPVLEAIRKARPAVRIVLTFFSPSGYEQKKDYPQADYIAYLPADSPANARDWVSLLRPQQVIFVKYEFWAYHLRALAQRRVPIYLIAASFRPKQVFFRWYGSFFKQLLGRFTAIFVQTVKDEALLLQHNCLPAERIYVAGDPRVDRVRNIAEQAIDFPRISQFKNDHRLLVVGSSWPPDETIVLHEGGKWLPPDWKILIAPHNIGEDQVQQIVQSSGESVLRYSQIDANSNLTNARILILDTIGMLSRVYHYADLAYIGGGFGVGIHNTLEPAAFHLPILFGPKYEKFPEAVQLVQTGGAFVVQNTADFEATFAKLQKVAAHERASNAVAAYVAENQGATQRIVSHLLSAAD